MNARSSLECFMVVMAVKLPLDFEDTDDTDHKLRLFECQCRQIVKRIDAETLGFVEGVDLAYEAAIWSGLADSVGDDAVQMVMAKTFCRLDHQRK